MEHIEQWIWLPRNRYGDSQNSILTGFAWTQDSNYVVAEFMKDYTFSEKVVRADIRFSADTAVQLYCNGNVAATGPAAVGGDFIGNDTPRENYYALETTLYPNADKLNFFARVKLLPVQIFEYSMGQGGFMLSAVLTFEDGTQTLVATDDTWLVRKNGSYKTPLSYDGRIGPDEFLPAEITENIWHTQTAPIPVRVEQEFFPAGCEICLAPMEEKQVQLDLDMVWGGFLHARSRSEGVVSARVMFREWEEEGTAEDVVLSGCDEYRGFYTHSAGNLLVTLKNEAAAPASVTISFVETHYPVYEEGDTITDDADMNLVLQLCKHTLKICRQTHHLDSTRHCEPLACTGDYYIESLMTQFSFGDMRLAAFDVERTAVLLERENGRMFHTTYSLIWVRMLRDLYMATGNMDLLLRCEKALGLLLNRFTGYLGENGLLETPPDYMFVDWIYIDGLSMHHPPKALGQSVLNMLYYMALDYGQRIYKLLEDNAFASRCEKRKLALQKAVNTLLYDAQKGMYFEGLNTPIPDELVNQWQAQNVQKRYYLKHSNIMAAYTGICDEDTARMLIEKVMTERIEGNVQPYFLHYLLEAIYDHGLRERYTLSVIDRWKPAVKICNKGLVEGFFPPEPGYSFDHSHAWGGSPLYSLPKALTGLTIVEAGYKKVKLNPTLLGLENASVEIPTPYGMIVCDMKQGQKPQVTVPKGIILEMEDWAQ